MGTERKKAGKRITDEKQRELGDGILTSVVRHGASKAPDMERKRYRAVACTTLVRVDGHSLQHVCSAFISVAISSANQRGPMST
jgi:hypothetical protein